MKKTIILIIMSIMIFSLVGCTIETQPIETTPIETRFEKIYEQKTLYKDEEFFIIVDKETKVQYLVFKDYRKGGMTILVDENGKPLLYTEE